MRTLFFICSFFLSIKQAFSEEILSKTDMATMFGMSLQEWKYNVITLSQAGLATYDSLPPLGYTLITDVPFGRVVTTPSYNSPNEKPWKMSVSTVFTAPESALLLYQSDDELRLFISEVFREMRPDYTVMSEVFVSKSQQMVVKSYQIFKTGEFPLMDELGSDTEGCRRPCIKRLD